MASKEDKKEGFPLRPTDNKDQKQPPCSQAALSQRSLVKKNSNQNRSDLSEEHQQKGCCQMKKKKIIFISVSIVVLLMIIVGLTLGLRVFRRPYIKEVKGQNEIKFDDESSMNIRDVIIQRRNLMKKNDLVELLLTDVKSKEDNFQSKLTEVNFKDYGFIVKKEPNASYTIGIEPDIMFNYILKQNPSISNYFSKLSQQQILAKIQSPQSQQRGKQFLGNLTKMIEEKFGKALNSPQGLAVVYLDKTYIDYCFNKTNQRFQKGCGQTKRRALCFWCKVVRAVVNPLTLLPVPWIQKVNQEVDKVLEPVLDVIISYLLEQLACQLFGCGSSADKTTISGKSLRKIIQQNNFKGKKEDMKTIANNIRSLCFISDSQKMKCEEGQIVKIIQQVKNPSPPPQLRLPPPPPPHRGSGGRGFGAMEAPRNAEP